MKDDFEQAQLLPQPTRESRELPPPEQLIAAGVTTRATLEHMSQRLPPIPRPQPSPEDPAGWRTAIANADAEHHSNIAWLRARFEARFDKARTDFKTARSVSPLERGKQTDQGYER